MMHYVNPWGAIMTIVGHPMLSQEVHNDTPAALGKCTSGFDNFVMCGHHLLIFTAVCEENVIFFPPYIYGIL